MYMAPKFFLRKVIAEVLYGRQLGSIAKNGTVALKRFNKTRVFDLNANSVVKTKVVTSKNTDEKITNVFDKFGNKIDAFWKTTTYTDTGNQSIAIYHESSDLFTKVTSLGASKSGNGYLCRIKKSSEPNELVRKTKNLLF